MFLFGFILGGVLGIVVMSFFTVSKGGDSDGNN
jgi:hypothetical protein